ncbi:hypothetical protein SARC_11052, partial [Sphaeroforma arctica JP610]
MFFSFNIVLYFAFKCKISIEIHYSFSINNFAYAPFTETPLFCGTLLQHKQGHILVIPKYCGERLHDIPDNYLADLLPVAKRVAVASGVTDYNILQNNGAIAHQVVKHVHVHMIPKPNDTE